MDKAKVIRAEERREDKLEANKYMEQDLKKAIKEDESKKVIKPIPTKFYTVINKTETIYDLTIDGLPYQIKPGRNELTSLEVAEAIVKDFNKSCPGETNNPFSLEK